METVFLKALKILIQKKLGEIIQLENNQASTFFYDKELSNLQAEILGSLQKRILEFQSDTVDDGRIVEEIAAMIRESLNELQALRKSHQHSENEGKAVSALNFLRTRVPDVYNFILKCKTEKTKDYSFELLNIKALNHPFHLSLQMLVEYMGKEVFNPSSYPEIHEKKQEKLVERMRLLASVSQGNISLKALKEAFNKTLDDAHSDNKKIVSSYSKKKLPGAQLLNLFNIYGATPNIKLASTSNLKSLISRTKLDIDKISEENFESLDLITEQETPSDDAIEEEMAHETQVP